MSTPWYAGLNPNFATAARFLLETALDTLPLGVSEVDGRKVYVNLADNYLNRADMAWKAHDRYADILFILRGREHFGWSSTAVPGPLKPLISTPAISANAARNSIIFPYRSWRKLLIKSFL